MSIDVAIAIEGLLPAAQFGGSLTANSKAAFDALAWTDARPKPTWAQVTAWWTSNGQAVDDELAAGQLIAAEAAQAVRELAVDRLKADGKLPGNYKLAR